nr:hypothetical protein [Tanacetum cinerariifolium]
MYLSFHDVFIIVGRIFHTPLDDDASCEHSQGDIKSKAFINREIGQIALNQEKQHVFNVLNAKPFKIAFLEFVKLVIISTYNDPIQMLVVMPFDDLKIYDSYDSTFEVDISSRFPIDRKSKEVLTFAPSMRDSPESMFVIANRYLTPHCTTTKILKVAVDEVIERYNVTPSRIRLLQERIQAPLDSCMILSSACRLRSNVAGIKPEEIPELMYKLREDVRNIREKLAEYIDSLIWNCPTFFYDEDELTIQYREYLEKYPDVVTTILPTKEPEHLSSMGYEHPSITPETESDEVTESNAEILLPIPIFTTFSNPLFKDNDNLDSSDDESLPDEDVPAEEFKIYSNPLFDEDEINSDKLDPHCFNVESDFVESLLNRDTFIDFSSKFDFSSELAHINPEIKEADFDFEEEIRLIENLLYDNSFPRPSEELNAEIADTIIESIPLLPIPVQDEEVDLFLSDNSIPPGIENVADDPEEDIRFLKELLIDDSILSDESFDFNFEDNPLIPQPPPKPPDVESFFDLKPDVIAEEISDKLNENKYFKLGGEIFVSTNNKDVDYFPFMLVIRIFLPYLILHDISPLLLSAESEDTIFDPSISD